MKLNQGEKLKRKINAVAIGMTMVLVTALLLVPAISSAAASSYQGNSNTEVSVSANASFVTVEMYIAHTLVFKPGNPNAISLQLNPDLVSSWAYQQNHVVVQPSIMAVMINGAPYIQFTIQIYDALGQSTWIQTEPAPLQAWSVPQALSAGTYWQIVEYLKSGQITSVYFVVNTGHGTPQTGTITPPSGYKWINSNVCLCGENGASATFTGGAGTLYYLSNLSLTTTGLPWLAATTESSNMAYGCMSGSGSDLISQSFGLSGAC